VHQPDTTHLRPDLYDLRGAFDLEVLDDGHRIPVREEVANRIADLGCSDGPGRVGRPLVTAFRTEQERINLIGEARYAFGAWRKIICHEQATYDTALAEVQRPVRWSWPSPPHEGEELDRDSVDLQVGFRWDNPER